MEWINVKDRLPEEGKEVLVWYEYNRTHQAYGISSQRRGYWSVYDGGMRAECLAWMPLPEPPKVREKND